jgi:hypothetical protein
MYNSTAWQVGTWRALEKPSEVFRPVGTEANVSAVYVLVGCAPGDQDDCLTLCFQLLLQRLSYATAVGEDQPPSRTERRRSFQQVLFGLPLKLIEPVIEILLDTLAPITAQRFEMYSLYLDSYLSGFVDES